MWSGKKYNQAALHLLRLLQVLRQQQALIAAEQMRVNRQATKAAAEEKKDLTEAEQKAKEEAEFKVR